MMKKASDLYSYMTEANQPFDYKPVQYYLIPGSLAHLPSGQSPNKEELRLLKQFDLTLSALINYHVDHAAKENGSVIFCGALHHGNNHYIPYFVYQKDLHTNAQVLFVDPSASDKKDKKQTVFESLCNSFKKILGEDTEFLSVDVTLQYRERSCGPNTMDVIENALATMHDEIPLLNILEGKLIFNELSLWRNGNRDRHYDFEKGIYFYSPKFVSECYKSRNKWNNRLNNINQIDYQAFDTIKYIPREVNIFTENYSYKNNLKNQANQDSCNENASVITAMLLTTENFASGDLMSCIKDKFAQDLTLPSDDEINSYTEVLQKTFIDMQGEEQLAIFLSQANQSLAELVRQSIIENLRPIYEKAIDKKITNLIRKFNLTDVDYDYESNDYLDDIISDHPEIAYYFERLDEETQARLTDQWSTLLSPKLYVIKSNKAIKKASEAYLDIYQSHLNTYVDLTSFVEYLLKNVVINDLLDDIAYLKKSDLLQALLDFTLNAIKSDIQKQFNQKYKSLAQDYTQSLSSSELISSHYDHGSKQLYLLANVSQLSIEHNASDIYKNFLFKFINQNFNKQTIKTYNTAVSKELIKLISSQLFKDKLKTLSNETLHQLKSVVNNLGNIHQELLILIQENEELKTWLEVDATKNTIITDLNNKLPRIITDILFQKHANLRNEITKQSLLQFLKSGQAPTNETLDQILKSAPHHFDENHLSYMIVMGYCEAIIDNIYSQSELVYKLKNEIAYINQCLANNSQVHIDFISIIKNSSSSTIALNSIQDKLLEYKKSIVTDLQKQLEKNHKSGKTKDNHEIRQKIVSLCALSTYMNKSGEEKNLPYFILKPDTAKVIDRYLVKSELSPTEFLDSQAKLFGLQDDEVFDSLESIDITQAIDTNNHCLTYECIYKAIATWIKYHSKEGHSKLIAMLNDYLSYDLISNQSLPESNILYIRRFITENRKNFKPGENVIVWYLLMTKEMKELPLLSRDFLGYLIHAYKGNADDSISKALTHTSDFMVNVSSLKNLTGNWLFKAINMPSILNKITSIINKPEYNKHYQLPFKAVEELSLLVKTYYRAHPEKANSCFMGKDIDPCNKILLTIATLCIEQLNKCNINENILHWLKPQYYPEDVKTTYFPQYICNLLGEDIQDTSINNIPFLNTASLEGNYIVDIEWIIMGYKANKNLTNPYTQEILSEKDFIKLIASNSPKVKELLTLWSNSNSVIKVSNETKLSKKLLDILVTFCQSGFFPEGIEGYYDTAQNKKFLDAESTLWTSIYALSHSDMILLLSHPCPDNRSSDTKPLNDILTSNRCVTLKMIGIARLIFVYTPEALDKFHDRLKHEAIEANKTSPVTISISESTIDQQDEMRDFLKTNEILSFGAPHTLTKILGKDVSLNDNFDAQVDKNLYSALKVFDDSPNLLVDNNSLRM